jgi:two-component system response regulator ResD
VSEISILIVDDEDEMRELMNMYLSREGYKCVEARDGYEALDKLKNNDFHLIVLDVMMPNLDGLSTCMKIRETSYIPIIFVTARGEEWDRVNGLKIGADDYLVKPFSPRELVARVEALLRRMQKMQAVSSDDYHKYGPIELDVKGHKVRLNGKELSLTLKEFDLLYCFTEHVGQALTREQLLEKVWGYEYYGNARTVDTHVKTLRMKLGDDGKMIQTVWGIGYKFEV